MTAPGGRDARFTIMPVFGTRPEAIKMASLVRELGKRQEINLVVAVTAQHRHLLDQALNFFHITPDYDLDLMRQDQTPSDVVGRILLHLEPVIQKVKPDCIVVQGDTSTALGASLTSIYNRIKLAHVEAGLRSGDKSSPYPEEENRTLIDAMSDFFFAPTESARSNLIREGVNQDAISVVGNTSIDVLKDLLADPRQIDTETVNQISRDGRKMILVTAHRNEGVGKPLSDFCLTLRKIAIDFNEEIQIVFPVHPNPRVREIVFSILSGTPNVFLLEPLVYNVFIPLVTKSFIVVTDSGGVQEEAAYLGKPTLVLRERTERPESLESGTAMLVGYDNEKLYQTIVNLLNDQQYYTRVGHPTNPYGDGRAATRIVDNLLAKLTAGTLA